MDAEKIKALLSSELPQCEIAVAGGDGKFQVTAVGNLFDGLNAVKRQQKVYQILNEHIASGAIHAVSMRLLTTAEHETT